MPNVPPPVDNDTGDQGWRTRTLKGSGTQSAASRPQLREGLFSSPHEGDVERKTKQLKKRRVRERAVIDCHQNLCDTSCSVTLLCPLQMTLKSSEMLCFNGWPHLFSFCSTFLISSNDREEFTFCMNIFFTLDFFFPLDSHGKTEASFLLIFFSLWHILIGYLNLTSLRPHLWRTSAQDLSTTEINILFTCLY